MDNYNPSFINPQAQLNAYLNDQMNEAARRGPHGAQYASRPSVVANIAAAAGGALLAKLILDLLDR